MSAYWVYSFLILGFEGIVLTFRGGLNDLLRRQRKLRIIFVLTTVVLWAYVSSLPEGIAIYVILYGASEILTNMFAIETATLLVYRKLAEAANLKEWWRCGVVFSGALVIAVIFTYLFYSILMVMYVVGAKIIGIDAPGGLLLGVAAVLFEFLLAALANIADLSIGDFLQSFLALVLVVSAGLYKDFTLRRNGHTQEIQ